MARGLRALVIFALLLAAPASMQAQTAPPARVALVIANGGYQSVPPLTNPTRDGQLIVSALRRAGFTVADLQRDLTKPQFDAALRSFKRQADAADIALVYYAGHGIELEEQNWLLPVDARIADPADALTEGVSLATVLRYVQGAKRVRVVVLDACRNNPFALRLASPSRAVNRGLRPVEGLPAGTIVAYSASFGQEAADGAGAASSPFAAALARRLIQPGLEVRFLFANVRDDVIATNAGSPHAFARAQRPWFGAELSAEPVFFVPPAPAVAATTTLTVLGANVRASDLGAEVEAFDAAAKAWTAAGWREFLQRFPNGRLKSGAEQALASLSQPAAPTAPGADPLAAARAALAAISPQDWSAAEPAALLSRAVAASSRTALEQLAAQGNARAQFVVGWGKGWGQAGFQQDLGEYLRLLRLAAAARDARAQTQLGAIFSSGCCGVAQDKAEAVRLHRLAAAQGNALGQASLGVMYSRGEGGLAQDKSEAARLYRLAAAQGSALGQANLGVMYDLGEGGLAVDKAEAHRLYRLAAAQGNATGLANLGIEYRQGDGGLTQDKAEAVRLFRLAAAQNSPLGQANLAGMYERGEGGLTANRTEAVRLYRLAARQGNTSAQANLRRLGETW